MGSPEISGIRYYEQSTIHAGAESPIDSRMNGFSNEVAVIIDLGSVKGSGR